MDALHHELFEPSHGHIFSFLYAHGPLRQWTHPDALRFLTIDIDSVRWGVTVTRHLVYDNDAGEDAVAKYGELFVLNRRWERCVYFQMAGIQEGDGLREVQRSI